MNGLSLEQEAVLTICRDNHDRVFNDPNSFEYSALNDLKTANMVDVKDSSLGSFLRFHGMLPDGLEHYNKARKERKQFKSVSDAADELMMRLAVEDRHKQESQENGETPFVRTNEAEPQYYRELSNAGLIDVRWADDGPYLVQVTDDGRHYAEGDFMNQHPNTSLPNIIINNNNQANSNANVAIEGTTINAAISALMQLSNVSEEDKSAAESAAKELDTAAKNKDKKSFAEKLETLAGILKNSTETATTLLPFVANAIYLLFS